MRSVILAQHHDQVLRRHLGDRVQRMRQHAAAGQGVQHLRGIRAHPGSGPRRQDEDRRFALRSQQNLLGFRLPPRQRVIIRTVAAKCRGCTAPSFARSERSAENCSSIRQVNAAMDNNQAVERRRTAQASQIAAGDS